MNTIYPLKQYVDNVYEENRRHKMIVIASVVLLIISVFAMMETRYYVSGIVALIVFSINIVQAYLKIRSNSVKIRDFSECNISLEDGGLSCIQTNYSDSLEECFAPYEDIEKIVESTKANTRGFYIFLNKKNKGVIFENGNRSKKNIFYVDGIGYSAKEFKDLYWNLLNRLNDNTVLVGTRNQSAWRDSSSKEELFTALIPLLALVLVFGFHVVSYLTGLGICI